MWVGDVEGVSEGRGGGVTVSNKEKESKMFNSSMLQSMEESSISNQRSSTPPVLVKRNKLLATSSTFGCMTGSHWFAVNKLQFL